MSFRGDRFVKKLIILLSLAQAASGLVFGAGFNEAGRAAGNASFENLSGVLPPAPAPAVPHAAAVQSPPADKHRNRAVKAGYDRIVNELSPKNLDGFSTDLLRVLFQAVSANKVASLDRLPYYDPSGDIGFCFGRAMAVHLIASRMGIKRESAGKAFIVGDLKSGQATEWRFHVAAVIRGTDGAWYAVDPILSGPMPLKEWIKTVREVWDKDTKAKIYITHPDAVLPDLRNFTSVDKEEGKNIIELSFRPEGRKGFTEADSDYGPLVFNMTPAAARAYFSNVHEKYPAGRFDFTKIAVNGGVFGYRDYFADLIKDINDHPQPPAAQKSGAVYKTYGREAGYLLSPRWWDVPAGN
jgi:hypothetical protein